MIIYHAVSFYQILSVIVHKATYHNNTPAVLLLPDFITNKLPQYKRIEELGLFDEVYLFPYAKIKFNPLTIVAATKKWYNRTVPYDIRSFEKIYSAGTHFFFSLVPIKAKLPFTAFEDSKGMIFTPDFLIKPLEDTFPVHAWIAKKYGLFSFKNEFISEVIVDKKNSDYPVNQTEFCLTDALSQLDDAVRKAVCSIFIDKTYDIRGDEIVLLTEQFSNLGMLTQEQQKALYRYVCETYYKGERLIIKPHPDDKTKYEELIENCTVMREQFPSELFRFVFSAKPKKIVTVSSTAVNHLKNYCETEFLADNEEFINNIGNLNIPTNYFRRTKK